MTTHVEPPGLFNPREILAILFRRRFWILGTMVAGLLAACGAIAMQRPLYRSSATLLIESQVIPVSVVSSAPLTSVANERIAKIRQQIVSNNSLTALVQDYKLYPGERTEMPLSDILEVMRANIGVELVGANQGNATGSTIAFTLSFTYEDPVKAQAITDQLTRLFLVADKRFRTEQATGTAAFLERRSDELRRQLARLEDKRRGVEARYAGALPEHVALSAQSGSALRAEVSRTDAETQGLIQQNNLLAVRMREDTLTGTPGGEALRRAEERLALLSARYADNFSEVRAARAAVEQQRAAAQASASDGGADVLATELAANHSRVEMLAQRRSELVRAMAEIEHRSAQAPQAAYELNMIEREYDNIKRQYESLREKQLDAQVTANLQSEDKGERFSVVDAPSLPHDPLGKAPLVLLLSGLVIGAAAGGALAIAFELLTGTIHGEASLTRILGGAPFGIIPILTDPEHRPWFEPAVVAGRVQALAALVRGPRHVH
ncbi:MAG: lipopolysaccharide biosynthesis protein [Novosphingobium sp.]